MIRFNKPYATGQELEYIKQAVDNNCLAGNGPFTRNCQNFLEERYQIPKVLLTTSCTTALEMMAMLLDIQPGDEVIMPSYTFVSSANAFVLRGARIVFADSLGHHPNVDVDQLEELITSNTKAILAVHYAGMACDMEQLRSLTKKHNIILLEDAAQALESSYKGKQLGTFGSLGAFSFHETKNITCGEGGALLINDPALIERAEILWEKGTNRSAFFRGEVDKYSWVDVGSSFLPSELNAAYLWAQLEQLDDIQERRKTIWHTYLEQLKELEDKIGLPWVNQLGNHNYHLFYLVCNSLEERQELIHFLKQRDIKAVFHYVPLHNSPYYNDKHDGRWLPNAEKFGHRLVRLPFYNDLKEGEVRKVCNAIIEFYRS